ncbi:response regulator, partial [Candidatus Obscuribacterales bacterium]|nr:response regulator [Candidatus Obscuribacterales bacterium]
MQSWKETFGELKEKYLKRSTERLAEILEILDGLFSNPSDAELIRRLSRNFHWLAGSGSMYGFQEVSQLGAEGEQYCESLLRGDVVQQPADVQKLKALISELSSIFSRGDGETTPLSAAPASNEEPLTRPPAYNEDVSDKPVILIIDEDQNNLAALTQMCDENGMAVRSSRNIAQAMSELSRSMPDGLILEIPLPDGDAYELVEKVRAMPQGEEPAIIIVSKQTGFLDKVRSIHCGADAHFEKPVDMKSMLRRLRYLLDKKRQEPPRILSVEDDPDQAAFIRAFLESAGYQVRTCTDPKHFDSYMSQFQPDLVLLDVMLPGMTGYELARYIRQDERHATLPVLFLTTQGQLDARIESARAGGDDHLVKPVPPALLLNSVSSRLERSRFLKTLLHKDGLTNLLNHTAFMEQGGAVVAQQRRQKGPVALIILDVDYFKSINERHGYPGGDKVLVALSLLLRRRLRQSDIIGRISGDEFAIIAESLDER